MTILIRWDSIGLDFAGSATLSWALYRICGLCLTLKCTECT